MKSIYTFLMIMLPFLPFAQIPVDTVYSKTITSGILREGQPIEGATINYTLIDTVNGTQELVRTALTDQMGQDIVDSLPVLKHYTGMQPIPLPTNKTNILITNNGTGSNHLIRFRTDAKQVSKKGYITNALGQLITTIPIQFNPATNTYDAIWKGEHSNQGAYVFQTKTGNKSIAEKIIHIKGKPTAIDLSAPLKETPQEINKPLKSLNEGEVGVSKYAININHPSIQDFVDTIRVQEDSFHEFFFNATGVQYSNANIFGELFFTSGGSPLSANIEYKQLANQSQIFSTIANNSNYNLQVPIVFEATNPGQTKYIVTISENGGQPFETLIDTLLISQGQNNVTHDLEKILYEDGDIWAQIFFNSGGSPLGANIEYKQLLNQTQIFSTTTTNGVYNIQVPIVYEATNPGQTKYIVTISENGGDLFETLIDTLLVSQGSNLFPHYVNQIIIDPVQDVDGIIKHVYTKLPESGVIIRAIDRTNGELIEEQTTGPDGKYFFADFPAGSLIEFQLGKPGELWVPNSEYDVPNEISDTLVTFNRYFYPKIVEIPMIGQNSSLEVNGLEIREMVGQDYVNFEEILRDADYMFAASPNAVYWAARDSIAKWQYQGNSPILTATTPRNITNDMQTEYEPYTNFFQGLLGWNVQFGSGNHITPKFATTNYGVAAVLGGEIMTTSGGTNYLAPVIKELLGRRLQLGGVASRSSMMNSNPALLNEKDRAIIHLILTNQKGRFQSGEETYSLEFITSEDPLNSYPRKDIPGNKPHCKSHFNYEHYQEQLQQTR